MASKMDRNLSYEVLLAMTPVVMDFLDINSEDVIASGILDDDHLDDAVVALILNHNEKIKSRLNQDSAQCSPTPSEDAAAIDSMHQVPMTITTDKQMNSGVFNRYKYRFSDVNELPQEALTPQTQLDTALPEDVEVLLEEMRNFRKNAYRSRFRMTEVMFDKLLQDANEHTSLSAKQIGLKMDDGSFSAFLTPKDMLRYTLRFLGCQEPLDKLAEEAKIPQSLYSRAVHETLDSLFHLNPRYICWTHSKDEFAEDAVGFKQTCGLDGLVGTIDVLHIKIKAPDEHAHCYVNAEGETTIILQTVCDHRLRFLHSCAGWPGSVVEDEVLKDSDLYADIKQKFHYIRAYYLLADEGYQMTKWLMTPYKTSDSTELSAEHNEFNAKCWKALENHAMASKLLMHRFPRLESLDLGDVKSQVVCILVCCALHNFCLDQGDLTLFEDAAVTVRNLTVVFNPALHQDGCIKTIMAQGKIRRDKLARHHGHYWQNT